MIVNIDLEAWKLSAEQELSTPQENIYVISLCHQVAELKEVFMLLDRDEDGVLSFQELQLVMKSMGQRPPGEWCHFESPHIKPLKRTLCSRVCERCLRTICTTRSSSTSSSN